MKREDTKVDYTGQKVFVGIDVHKSTWHVATCTQNTNPAPWQVTIKRPFVAELKRYLSKHFPNAEYICAYEAGFCGYWPQKALQSEGISTIVVNAADIPTSDKERKQKTDKRDARKIARSLKNGELKALYVPDDQPLFDRDLLRERYNLVKCGRRIKCQIKSHLALYNIQIPEDMTERHWSKRYIQWLEQIQATKKDQTLLLQLARLEQIRKLQLEANKMVRELSRSDRYADLNCNLLSVPGVGRLTVMLLITELFDITRFKNINHLCSYVGLIPTSHKSGENEKVGQLTTRRNVRLRTALIESSWVAIKSDSELLLKYEQYKTRMSSQRAIVRVARILLRRIAYVWRSGERYVKAVA